MPAFVVYGDSFLVRQRMAALEAEHGADAVMEANRHRFQGNQVSPQELLGTCQAIPFLDSLRLVVVDGLLAIAESRSGRRQGAARLQQCRGCVAGAGRGHPWDARHDSPAAVRWAA